jgi:hypothetical protein
MLINLSKYRTYPLRPATRSLRMGASAIIAEMTPTNAAHMLAPTDSLYPPAAVWTNLKVCTTHKLLEGHLRLFWVSSFLILLARNIFMPIGPTLKAIVVLALGAVELFAIPLHLEHECVVAIGGGAPGDVLLNIQRGFQREFLKFR